MMRRIGTLVLGAVMAAMGCTSGNDGGDEFWDGGEELCELGGRSNFFEVDGGEFWMCDFPDPADGAVDVDGYEGSTSLVNGAAAAFDLRWSGADLGDRTLILGVRGDGFYRVPPGGSDDPYPLEVEILQSVSNDFDLWVGFADEFDEGGHPITGETIAIPIQITRVLTGDVQVNVHWDTLNDVDLHVVDPTGYEIYWGQPSSPSGGQLDLDSNPACYTDGINNENIYWPEDGAPAGEYTVRVDLWQACTDEDVTYRVTIILGGEDLTTHDGTFTPSDASMGGLGAGELVATFEW